MSVQCLTSVPTTTTVVLGIVVTFYIMLAVTKISHCQRSSLPALQDHLCDIFETSSNREHHKAGLLDSCLPTPLTICNKGKLNTRNYYTPHLIMPSRMSFVTSSVGGCPLVESRSFRLTSSQAVQTSSISDSFPMFPA